MGRFRDFIHTGSATGMPLVDAVGALLAGATGMPPPIRDLLQDCREDSALLSIALAAMQILDDVPSVAVPLSELGIHPLSLFLSPERMSFETWLNERPRHKQWFHEGTGNPCIDHSLGILRIAGLQPSAWLRAIDPGLKMVLTRSTKVALLEDSCITHLLDERMCLGSLEIRSCSGVARMPSLIPGNLQLLFSDAIFRFPMHMEIRGKAEIHGCSGIDTLPEELRVERLIVEQCPRLRLLPRFFHDMTHLDIVGAPVLSFPAGVKDLQYLRLASLPNLENLPLPSGEILDAELRCLPSLVEIQAPVRFSIRNLFVTQCDRLRRMPHHMGPISGNVILARLPELEVLPSRLSIEGDLRIISCPGLRSLPEGMTVGGAVEIRDCPNLDSIPKQIRASLI